MQQPPNILQKAMLVAPVVSITIAINVVVFVLWQFALRDEQMAELMAGNFLVSTRHLEEGYVWTLVTSVYSHLEVWHIALNMLVLWSFGVVLENSWRRKTFLAVYLVCGVVGSASHCLVDSLLLSGGDRPALGASGAIAGLLMAFAMQFPKSRILLFGVVPVPALVGVGLLVAFDVYGLFAQTRGGGVGIGHGAHLGGALAGAALWFGHLRRSTEPGSNSPFS